VGIWNVGGPSRRTVIVAKKLEKLLSEMNIEDIIVLITLYVLGRISKESLIEYWREF